MDKEAWVAKPNSMFSCHPRGDIGLLRYFAIITDIKRLPGNIADVSGIYGIVEVVVIKEGWFYAMFSPMCHPDLHQVIDVARRHLSLGVEELSELKLCSTGIGCPIIGTGIVFVWARRAFRGQRCTMLIAGQTCFLVRLNKMIK